MALAVRISDARGRPVRAPGLAAWLQRVAPAGTRGVVSIALVTDAHMRKLNRRYRGKDHVTDVLSFEASSPQPPASSPYMGEIVIARGVARRQARAARHSLTAELRVLSLHGLLHLLGYDHETDTEAGEMERHETEILGRLGVPDPYGETG